MREPTAFAVEEPLVPVRLVHETAFATSQACEPWVNQDYSLTPVFGFVDEELPELEVSPIASHPVELPTLPIFSYVIEIFHSKHSERFFYNLFTETVVVISHEPSLSTTKSFELSLSGTSANGLKFLPYASIPSFDSFDFVCFDNSVIGTNSKIIDTQVYPKNFFTFKWFNNTIFNNDFDSTNISMDVDNYTLHFPRKILMKIFGNFNRVFFSSLNSCKLNLTALKKNLGGSQVEPNATEQTFGCVLPILISFEHFYGVVSCTLDEGRREIKKFFSNLPIQGFVKLVLGIGLEFKTFLYMKVRNGIVLLNSLKNLVSDRNAQTDYSLHRLFLFLSIFIL